LVSMQADLSERDELSSYFDDVGYTYFDETENMAVSLFMKS
jgi:threonine dehydratase